MIDQPDERRWRLIHRGLPALGGLAALALAAGLMVGSLGPSEAEGTAREFTRAWSRGDYAGMYRLLTGAARARVTRQGLGRAYEGAAATATAVSVEPGDPAERDGRVLVPLVFRTRVFGALRGELSLPVEDGAIAWRPSLVFPGLAPGVTLSRRSEPPRRGTLLSRDGKVLAEGPAGARSSPLGPVSGSIAGGMSREETAKEREELYARGFPRDWPVGQTGLEQAFEHELAGRPGGELLAGARVLARARARRAPPLRTTIDSGVQEAAVAALGGRFGGVAALDARTAEVRALAGIAYSAPQPPAPRSRSSRPRRRSRHGS